MKIISRDFMPIEHGRDIAILSNYQTGEQIKIAVVRVRGEKVWLAGTKMLQRYHCGVKRSQEVLAGL